MLGVVFKEFRVTFFVLSIHLVLFGYERGSKFMMGNNSGKASYLESYQDNTYLTFFYMKSINQVVYYYTMISTGIQIADPNYYLIDKWIK